MDGKRDSRESVQSASFDYDDNDTVSIENVDDDHNV